jgi:Fur family transcriptional regulator, ferric uptake regulator
LSHHEIHYDQRIREQGYRLTPQRQAIMEALCAIGDHASISDVYERVHAASPVIDRATVYRTLHFFRDLSLVTASEIDGETRYEVAGPAAHHHLICRDCGAEITIEDDDLQGLFDHLAARYGFTAELQHLVIPGVCAGCQTAPAEKELTKE